MSKCKCNVTHGLQEPHNRLWAQFIVNTDTQFSINITVWGSTVRVSARFGVQDLNSSVGWLVGRAANVCCLCDSLGIMEEHFGILILFLWGFFVRVSKSDWIYSINIVRRLNAAVCTGSITSQVLLELYACYCNLNRNQLIGATSAAKRTQSLSGFPPQWNDVFLACQFRQQT